MTQEMTDRNLLFGLIAMQSDLIEMRHFVDACTLWGSRKETSLADILVEQGWLVPEDRQHVDYLLQRRLQKSGGDVKQPLSGMSDDVKLALYLSGRPRHHRAEAGRADISGVARVRARCDGCHQ